MPWVGSYPVNNKGQGKQLVYLFYCRNNFNLFNSIRTAGYARSSSCFLNNTCKIGYYDCWNQWDFFKLHVEITIPKIKILLLPLSIFLPEQVSPTFTGECRDGHCGKVLWHSPCLWKRNDVTSGVCQSNGKYHTTGVISSLHLPVSTGFP